MLADASTLEDGAVLRADICIVGAGAAGVALARELVGSGEEILLLEGGGLESSGEAQDLYRGAMVGLRTFDLHRSRARVLGGTTSLWAGFTMPLQEDDFTLRDHVPGSGWPISFSDLAPYYVRAGEFLETGTGTWDPAALIAADGKASVPLPNGDTQHRFYRFSNRGPGRAPPPTNTGVVYRELLEDAEDLVVYHHAAITNIVLDPSHAAVVALEGRVFGDTKSFRVEAERYVLALGGIENARMLLASNQQLPAGIGNASDAVGRYFMEHPHLFDVGGFTVPSEFDMSLYTSYDSAEVGSRLLGVIGLTEETRRELGLLDVAIELADPASPNEALDGITPTEADALLDRDEEFTFRRIHLRCEQSPRPDSRLVLSQRDVDAHGTPRVVLDWRVHEDDLESYKQSVAVLAAEFGAAGLGRVHLSLDDAGTIAGTIQAGHHHMGTTRMSTSADDGVVDANCRVHDLDNLYIAGSSVFTTGGAANPTLTIVALAIRLADHLRAREEEE